MCLRKMKFHLLDRKITLFELHVTISELDIIPGKLSVRESALEICYSPDSEGLTIRCNGDLLFLGKYKTSVHFSFPTATQEGHVCFENYDGLKFKDLLQEFGWLTNDVKSNHILNEVLAIAVRKVDISFEIRDDKLQIKALNVSIFKEQLDIGLLIFRNIELDVTTAFVNSCYVTSFSLGAFISEALFAQINYDPERNDLSGEVKVIFAKSASAVDVLQLFNAPTNAFENMKSVLKDEFMDVFNSNLKNHISTRSHSTVEHQH